MGAKGSWSLESVEQQHPNPLGMVKSDRRSSGERESRKGDEEAFFHALLDAEAEVKSS